MIPGDEAFTGNFPDDAAAGAEVAAVGDIYFRYQGDMKLRVCRSITPGETAIESFRFKRLLNVHDLETIEGTTALLSENAATLRNRIVEAEDAAVEDRNALRDESADRASGDDIQIRTIGDADTYNEEVGNQQAAKTPMLIHIGVAIAGTYNGQDYAWPAGQILYVKPLLTALEFPDPWFVLHDSSETSGQTAAQVQAAIRALLNPETAARVAGDEVQRVQAANAAAYETAVADQRNSAMGLFIVATADFTATVSGAQHEVTSGDVIYFAPLSVSPKRLFTLPNNTTGRTEAQVNDQIDAKLPPFSDVSLWPVGVPSPAVPENLYVNLGDPNARANDITAYTVFVHGTEVTRATNLPGRYKVSGGVLPIPISLADRTTIAGNFRDGITFYPVIIRFTFSDTSSHDHELQMLVNNSEFAEPTEWPGDLFVIPHELPISPIAATTFTVIPRIADGAYPTGARMRITIGGVSGAYHTLADNQERTLALTLVQMQNAVQGGAARGWLIGSVTIHPADADTQLDRIQFQIPLTSNRHHGALAYAAATSMNADRFDVVDLTLTGNTTFNITGGNDGDSAMLRVIQGGTANYTVTLNAAISRGGRDAPVVATANNARSYLMFTKVGATWVYLGAITDD